MTLMTPDAAVGTDRRPPEPPVPPTHDILLVDVPAVPLRRPGDLVGLTLSLAGIAAVLVLAVYAPRTTRAVSGDVATALAVVRSLLLAPLTALEGVAAYLVPAAVLVAAVSRRALRTAAGMVLAAAASVLAAVVLLRLGGHLTVVEGVLDPAAPAGSELVGASPYVAGLTALLTVAASDMRHRAVPWTLLWVVLGVSVIQGRQTMAGAAVFVLLGHAVGLLLRYLLGAGSDRASGPALVRAVRRAGLDPVRILRRDVPADGVRAVAWRVRTSAPVGYPEPRPFGLARPIPEDVGAGTSPPGDSITVDEITDAVAARAGMADAADQDGARDGARHYAAWDTEERRYDISVLDGDRQVLDYLGGLWDTLRIRGLRRRGGSNLRENAGHTILMILWAQHAGVRTPPLVGVAAARNSVIMITAHIPGLRPLADLPAEELDDTVLDDVWQQLRAAHGRGLSHNDLDARSVLVDAGRRVRLAHWDHGDTLASELAQRIDLAQALVLLAVHAGPDRAIASATRSLGRANLAAVAPLVQPVALPASTRVALRPRRHLLEDLRRNPAQLVPTASTEPARINRFSPRTVVLVVVGGVAAWVLMGSLGSEDVASAISGARPGWMVAAFLLGMVTYLGSSLGLVAFSPERLGLVRTTLVQLAASLLALVVPAGVGPAGLNLRFLQRRQVALPVAIATVGLTQLMQFLMTMLLLVSTALLTGSVGTLTAPSPVLVIVVLGAAMALMAALALPPVRRWALAKVRPTLAQLGPRLSWLTGHPSRVALGALGGLLLSAGYIAAFGASLAAFGDTLPLVTLAITYLGASAAGSLIPSPGGIGPIELALTGGLTVAGMPYGTALSTTLLFRLADLLGTRTPRLAGSPRSGAPR
ncbi:UPF0104 family protein [Georgenia yuyongxinii]|uniref:UPF0104 family protein n=1 Tax=Georgenia yuyongxinii TaxID=2589797 RepID=A0A5B8C2P4_9MICO|nr:lysylphosphatidylglycerol synthase transmembrane domain-containing protein [Georgenia yuyongxinii]QDC23791.1 UPF0104 family protein [Georgenia yuyongxinii]